MSKRDTVSTQVAKRSKSNLAFALTALPRDRRQDMITFYAFCRIIDDIADEPGMELEERQQLLEEWRQGLLNGFTTPDELQAEVAELPKRYDIAPELFAEIIEGVEADLVSVRYATYEELLSYCYKVASVVGLVSTEIFGCKHPASKEYAIQLGYALQLTNIIRDVGEDAGNGRIYLPLEDLARFHVTEQEIMEGQYSTQFERLMQFEYVRARAFFVRAQQLLPREDRRCLLAAEMMGQIYSEILEKIRRRRFRVFDARVKLSKLRKVAILGAYAARGAMGGP